MLGIVAAAAVVTALGVHPAAIFGGVFLGAMGYQTMTRDERNAGQLMVVRELRALGKQLDVRDRY